MAETETSASPSSGPEAHGRPTFDAAQGLPAIALSEENLLALLGSSAPPSAAPLPIPTPVSSEPAAVTPTPTPAPMAPAPVTPAPVKPAPVMPSPAVKEISPRAMAAPPPRPVMVDSTLALLAAIKENRADLLRTDTSRTDSSRIQVLREETARAESLRIQATTPASAPVISSLRAAHLPDAFFTAAAQPSPLESALAKVPGGPRTLLIVGALIAVGGISTGLLIRSHRAHKSAAIVSATSAPIPAPAPNANFPLRLQLAGPGKGPIEVRWNPKSTLIVQARAGRLVVTEANQPPRIIPLALSQLEVGHLTYQQQTDRAELRLEVVDPSGSVAEESAMSGTPGATPAASAIAPRAAVPVAGPAAVPATSITTAVTAAAPLTAGAPATAAAPAANRPEPRAFTPPSVNRAVEPNSIVDAPPAVDASPAAPISLIYAPVPRTSLPPPPPAAVVPALTPASARIRVDGNLQAAKLVKQIAPVYPPLAKTARVQGTIRFQAVIGKDGVIRNLEVIGGPPLLRPAAIDAVKQWTYRPTLLNGQAVEVNTTIEVLFSLGQ
jgi:TonB family protein